jgi:hypothetical protein
MPEAWWDFLAAYDLAGGLTTRFYHPDATTTPETATQRISMAGGLIHVLVSPGSLVAQGPQLSRCQLDTDRGQDSYRNNRTTPPWHVGSDPFSALAPVTARCVAFPARIVRPRFAEVAMT